LADERPGGRGELDRLFAAWRLSTHLHDLNDPADEASIDAAERAFGGPLPTGLKALYRFSDGMGLVGGNLAVEPLEGLVGMSGRLRSWKWPIPNELLMFGGNGSDDLFGLWYPAGANPDAPTPVIMVGSIFEPRCLALAGTDLPAFLRAWSGYFMVLLDASPAALDVLGLPPSLRVIDEHTGIAPYFQWADPTLPDPEPDPYARGLDRDGVVALLRK
jgi:hypothetical protein